MMADDVQRIAWKVRDYERAIGFGRAQIWKWIASGELETVKIGGSRVIVTRPEDFINRHRAQKAA